MIRTGLWSLMVLSLDIYRYGYSPSHNGFRKFYLGFQVLFGFLGSILEGGGGAQKLSKKSTGIPITVRQLEAIIRLSEAIAKIHLQTQVKVQHVEEAVRIFKISTLSAVMTVMTCKNIFKPAELIPLIWKVQEAIKRRVAIGTKISYHKLQQEMMQRFDNAKAIDYAIICMIKQDEFIHMEGRKILHRKR